MADSDVLVLFLPSTSSIRSAWSPVRVSRHLVHSTTSENAPGSTMEEDRTHEAYLMAPLGMCFFHWLEKARLHGRGISLFFFFFFLFDPYDRPSISLSWIQHAVFFVPANRHRGSRIGVSVQGWYCRLFSRVVILLYLYFFFFSFSLSVVEHIGGKTGFRVAGDALSSFFYPWLCHMGVVCIFVGFLRAPISFFTTCSVPLVSCFLLLRAIPVRV